MWQAYPFLDRLEIEPESDSPLDEEIVLQMPLSCKSGEGERDRDWPPYLSIFSSFFLEALLLMLLRECIIYKKCSCLEIHKTFLIKGIKRIISSVQAIKKKEK